MKELLKDIRQSLKLIYFLFRKDTIFLRRSSNAMGDNLLLTGLLPELRKRNPNKKIIVESSRWTTLFFNNPYVDWTTSKHFKTTKRHFKPKYHIDRDNTTSIYNQIGKRLGFDGMFYPKLYLTREEIKNISDKFLRKLTKPVIVFCPYGKKGYSANRKEWGSDNFQRTIDLTSDNYHWIQVGLSSDNLLQNVIDARGLSIRESASLFSQADLALTLEGGLMHLAKAVDTLAVVIYGGAISPLTSGYPENHNIYNKVHCSPCFRSDKALTNCEEMICMDKITPESVIQSITDILAKSKKKVR